MIVMRMLGQIDHIDKRYNKAECEYEYQQTYPRHVAIGARPVNGSQRRTRYGTQDGRMPIQDVIKQGRTIVHSLIQVGCAWIQNEMQNYNEYKGEIFNKDPKNIYV